MSINHAILGVLTWQPSTGYDLKKVFESSSALYWSGNNNQIYKALVQLLEQGLVSSETVHQDGAPSKKIYQATDSGRAELKQWVLSTPSTPEFKKMFLIQLAWADILSTAELLGLLKSYEEEVYAQLLMEREKNRRALFTPNRTPRETLLWEMIGENLASSYENELRWIDKVRRTLVNSTSSGGENPMDYSLVQTESGQYLEFYTTAALLATEQDALDVIALCGEHDTNSLLLHGPTLAPGFFDLKTGIAGAILQKFVNYSMRVAIVVTPEQVGHGRFAEMAGESATSNQVRIYTDHTSAAQWLTTE